MVLQKRLYYGFNGYQIPTMPRGSRSARGKRSVRKKVEENQMCAFELLATVAGKLLLENESSPRQSNFTAGDIEPGIGKDTVKKEHVEEVKPFVVGPCDQGSCDEGTGAADRGFQRQAQNFQRHAQKYTLRECSQTSSGVAFASATTIISEKASVEDSTIKRSKGEYRNFLGLTDGKPSVVRCSPGSAESYGGKIADGISTPLQVECQRTTNKMHGNIADEYSLEDPMELDTKPPPLVSSDSSFEVPVCGDHIPCGRSFSKHQNDIELTTDKDDDENSSGYSQPCTIPSKHFRPQRIGDRRIRKLLASKLWKVGPTLLKDAEFSNTEEVKPVFRSRKMCYTRQRTQRGSFKRRKLFERCSISTSDGPLSSEGICLPKNGMKGEASCSAAHGGTGTPSSIAGQKSTFHQSEDYQVKLCIKSFKVPELFIEIPETATVGSLKRTVMEAVTAILGGGLRVGVLLQGKKVRDDNKTLLQAGISHSDKLDGLGFTLEPSSSQAPQQLTNHQDAKLLPSFDTVEPLASLPAISAVDPVVAETHSEPPAITWENCLDSDHDSVPSPTVASTVENTTANFKTISKALVPVPAMNVEALAVVPLQQKSKRSELIQRRIRRPFSVAEVEALVQAVEKLGTGRWRDVKLRAFDNAKHRTYVDLKDKWKTLVHTARISPQQRRGEPVPQELLDRVLSAHAYWSQQQAKLQVKQQQAEIRLLL